MKRKDVVELYRNNTSKYTKLDNIISKLGWIITPLLILGIFKGNDFTDLLCTVALLILAIVELVVLILDSYNRVKNGKNKEKS